MAEKLLEIHLLGAFNITYDGQPLTTFQADRPQALLTFLLLHRHAPQSRRHIAFLLWPDSTESQALNNLRNLLHTVRRALPNADRYLAVDSLTLQWRSDALFRLDVAELEQALAVAQTAPDTTAERAALKQAVALSGGELLPANYDEWLIPLRQDLNRRYQQALQRLLDLAAEARDVATAVVCGERLQQQDPLNESLVIQLMQLHALAGDRSAIRRVYQNCELILADELGVSPDPATQEAYEKLLAQVVAAPPALAMTPRPLPTPATPFIGREAELRDVGQLLADPHCRLLTITGPGGMGKTRLALQTAVQFAPLFPDGVAYAPLRSLNSASFLPAAIANSLNLHLVGQLDTAVQLHHHLAAKKLLIVLDNFEHLLDGVAQLADLLAHTPGVKLLVTSRQRLNLQEEWLFELGELPLPDDTQPAEIAANSAVALFMQSARRAVRQFILTPADYAHVAHICRLVGGLPLGIELAASWTRLLTCAEIAQEIEQGIDFLAASTHNMPAQHHSLRAVFDHSWSLLTAEEQQFLPALSLFQGQFTRQAAAALGARLPILSALHDKSLLRRMGPNRYSLHELVRQYAAERLSADAQAEAAVRARHGRYYLNLLIESEALLFGGLRDSVFEELTTSLENIRTAWAWGLAQKEWTLLNRAARTYATLYELHSWNQEGLRTLTQTTAFLRPLADPKSGDPGACLLRGAMLSSSGWFHFRCGQLPAARSAVKQGLGLIRAVASQTAVAADDWQRALQFSLFQLSMVAYASGDYAAAERALLELMGINEARADSWGAAYTQAILGMVRFAQGEAAAGYQLLQKSVAAWRKTRSPRLGVFCLSFYSAVAQALGEVESAAAALEEGMTLAQAVEDRYGMATFGSSLGALSLKRGEYARATRLVSDSLAIFTDIGDLLHVAQSRTLLGEVYLAQADYAAAEEAFGQAFETAVAAQAIPYALEALINLAELYAQTGREPEALLLAQRLADQVTASDGMQSRADALRARLVEQGVELLSSSNAPLQAMLEQVAAPVASE